MHELHGMITPAFVTDAARAFDAVSITDLSCLPGCGFKGPLAETALRSFGVVLPSEANSWTAFHGGGVALRLGRSEFLFQDGPDTNAIGTLLDTLKDGAAGVYSVSRQDLVLALTGPKLPELFAQTCSFDFGEFERKPDLVAMTTMIGVSVTLIARDFAGRHGIQVWCDSTFGIYFFVHLFDLVEELGGGAAGICDLYPGAQFLTA